MSRFYTAGNSGSRLYYLDWLRVLAMFSIFFFHNARFYDAFSDWHVRNATTNLGASILVAFMGQWMMPLFFLIAGASVYHALRIRQPWQFVQERSLRLLVPLVIGMVFIVAPQGYFDAVSHGTQFGGYNAFQIYGLYLQSLPDLNWFHLWFLVYLFVFSIFTLPIFITWTRSGRSAVSRLATAFGKPWSLLPLLVLCLALVNILIYPDGSWGTRNQGGWSAASYLLFFIFGYLIFANMRIMEAVKRLGWVFLATAIVANLSLFFFLDELLDVKASFGSPMYIGSQVVQAVSTWCWLLAILGLGSRFLDRTNRFLSYANEAVLPFYILHQTVIIVIGFYVVQWDTGVGIKYITISTTSFVAIMLIYELLVRRIGVLRFLFGMRPGRPREKTRAALAGAGES